MIKYNCIIIEDEPLAIEKLENFIQKVPFLKNIGSFDDPLAGLSFLNSNKVDILFLDINLDELSGIELLENSKIKSEIIITTAYQEHAVKGYELNISDYLLKPFTFNRFLKAINKLSFLNNDISLEYIFVKTENRLEKIVIKDILYIEGMRDYRMVYTHKKKILTSQTFKEFETIFPPDKIPRVHKSYMVSVDKIDSIERSTINISNKQIPISHTYKDTFLKLFR